VRNLKKLILLNDGQKYQVAQNLLNEIIIHINNIVNVKIDEAILCLLDENKKHNRFEILCSSKNENNFKCKIIEPKIIDKFSISYITKKSYFDNNFYIDFVKIENFYIFIYIEAQDIHKYLDNIKEFIEGKFNE